MNQHVKAFSMKKQLKFLLFITLVLSVLFAVIVPSPAISEAEYDMNSPQVKSIADHLSMEGHSEHDISTCATKQRYYEEIIELLNKGHSEEEILDDYIESYGEEALRAPNKSGFSLLAWAIPFVVIASAGIGLYVRIKRKVVLKDDVSEKEDPLDSDDEEIFSSFIDEERKKYY